MFLIRRNAAPAVLDSLRGYPVGIEEGGGENSRGGGRGLVDPSAEDTLVSHASSRKALRSKREPKAVTVVIVQRPMGWGNGHARTAQRWGGQSSPVEGQWPDGFLLSDGCRGACRRNSDRLPLRNKVHQPNSGLPWCGLAGPARQQAGVSHRRPLDLYYGRAS